MSGCDPFPDRERILYNETVRPERPQATDLESVGGHNRPAFEDMNKLKPFIGPAITTILIMALVTRVEFLRKLVYGA